MDPTEDFATQQLLDSLARSSKKMAPISPAWYDGGLIDLRQPSFWIALGSILFNPTFWNIVAQTEYRTRFLTKTFGSPYRGCYALAITIFSLGIFRDHLYQLALADQPSHPSLQYAEIKLLSVLLFSSGSTLVLTSMYALGVTGTYLGDYFGILMDDMVEGFPFNVCGSPMYYGSTMSFLATALWYEKPAGILLTAILYIAYEIALRFEDPFTAKIYAARDEQRRRRRIE